METKKTALYEAHVKLGAKMVEFAGWLMPIQYEGIIQEHLRVREYVGLFDVSHMGEIFVTGPEALPTLQWLTSNDVSVLKNGEAQYSLLLNPQGGVVDDIIVYCIEKGQNYLVCVNAANVEKDFNWMSENNKGATITNESEKWAQIAIQGPQSSELVARTIGPDCKSIPYFTFKPHSGPNGTWYVARTGYTGEDGFEVFLPQKDAASFWDSLLEKGQDLQVGPIGLGARDTLRTEMKYSLYGHEITDLTNALEAGLGWVVKFAKGDFIGKSALEASKGKATRKLVGFKLLDRGIPRQGYPLISLDNLEVGVVTSGTMSPSLSEAIGVGYVDKNLAQEGSEFFVQIRSRNIKAVVVKTPFVRAKTKAV